MEALRYFKLAHGLRCAASEVTGALPLMKVSDYLSFLAEAILGQGMLFQGTGEGRLGFIDVLP